ncbi:MAG: rhodanese-like domain-containing protein [Polaromonas sp.]|jgi:rhodanese-related sulfurtransferase|nr:rhodanese-like domain-containing protein [Polaromonas sp.]MBK7026874.1 rhodanese-like domain-containing protein [Polaromonas sp.]HRH05052.1 rhodanese-like domain-containing protein [Burkholderiaceae bacterium]
MKSSIIHRIQSIASTAILTLFLGISSMNAFAAPPVVSLDDARKALETDSSAIMIDIREPSEHANGVAKGAKLIPMSQLGRRLAELPKPGAEKFMVICATQNRSANIVGQLQQMGYTNASYVHGGMSGWSMRAWPMIKP